MIQMIRGRSIALAELAIGAAMVVVVVLARPPDFGSSVFLGIADKVAAGLVPYRDFPVEYPPLALIPLVLPRFLAGGGDAAYEILFGLLSLVFTVAVASGLAWLADRGWSATSRNQTLLAFVCLVLAAAPQVFWRFDIFPALLTVIALVAVASRRPGWAGFALALGAAAKLYPAFLVPVLVAYYLFGRSRRGAAMTIFGFGAVGVAVGVLLILVAGRDAFTFLSYQEDRGIEIESVLGGIILLAHNLFGTDAAVTFGFGSFQVESSLERTLALPNAIGVLALGTILAVGLYVSFNSDSRAFGAVRPRTLVTYLLAALLLVMLANKVLSPQYLAWLLPFGALLPWRQSLLLVVVAALTTVVYPLVFDALREAHPTAVAVLNVRNALLLVLFIWLAIPRRRTAAVSDDHSVAMLETPPSKPAPTPNMRSPIASRRRRGAITVISTAANATVTTLARVRPGRPISCAR